MKRTLILWFISVLLAGGFAIVHSSFVSAAAPPGVISEATVIRIVPVPPQPLAKNFSVTAVLTTADGHPVPDRTVNFLVGGIFQGQSRTDAQGQATVIITNDLAAGNYTLKALFQGSRDFQPSANTVDLTIQPGTIEIYTVPPLPGIQFRLNGTTFVSGKDGIARLPVIKSGTYRLEYVQVDKLETNQRVEFNRWMDEIFVPYRDVKLPLDKPLQVGLQVSYRVGQTFIDLQNKPVDLSRITSITLKSSQGTTYTFSDGAPRWLPASIVTRRISGLEVVEIQYSVMSVVVDGSNVVSQAQQRFYGHPGEIWTIQLLLFSARVEARDAFLGVPVGKGIVLEYPDGTRQSFTFGPDRTVTVSSLARGIYHVQVTGVSGLTPVTPVALSQNQEMDLSVLTRLDIFVSVTAGTLFALSLILIGRTRILDLRRLKGRPAFAPGEASDLSGIHDR